MSGSHLEPTWLQFHVLRTYRRAARWRQKAESESRRDLSSNSSRMFQMALDNPKTGEDRPQTGSRQVQDKSKTGQNRPKTRPRQARDTPRPAPDRPRHVQDEPKTGPDRPRQVLHRPKPAPRANLARFFVPPNHAKPWFFLRIPPGSVILRKKCKKCEKYANIVPT